MPRKGKYEMGYTIKEVEEKIHWLTEFDHVPPYHGFRCEGMRYEAVVEMYQEALLLKPDVDAMWLCLRRALKKSWDGAWEGVRTTYQLPPKKIATIEFKEGLTFH